MKGVILAGGLGTRLYPLTFATNKHLLPVFDRPMIFYPIRTLVEAGVTDILVITSGPHAGHFIRVLKNGKELGIRHLEYAYQEKPDGGIADALALAQDFAHGDSITVILGDNTTDANIGKYIEEFRQGAVIFLKSIPKTIMLKRFGVAVFDDKDKKKLISIEEKPMYPRSNLVATGLYIYDKHVFAYIQKCKPSGRGEIEITDVNNLYIKSGKFKWHELDGFWSDAGTYETLFAANRYWAEKSGL